MDIIKNDFKTIQLVSYHSDIDDKSSRVYRYLLSKLIVAQTNKYQTKKDMSIRLEALYGALLSTRCELNGNIHTISISLTIADPKVVGDPKLLEDAIVFFKSLIYDHNEFDEAIFNDEKRQLIEQWQSLKDNKAQYASYRFNELFRSPDLTGYPLTGTLSHIRRATKEGLFDYYQNVFLNNDMHVVVNGNIEDQSSLSLLNEMTQEKHLHFRTSFRKVRKMKETIETAKMNQAIIKLGYVFPIYRFDPSYPAALLANVIIGGYPESRLFKEIRENQALCYDISSNYDVYKGTLVVSSGVAIETLEDAKQEMIHLIDNMMSQGITEEELSVAKGYVIHQLKAGLDHQSYFTKKAYYAYLTKQNESIESRILGIEQVILEDVNQAIKQLKLDTSYVLKGDLS